MNESSEAEEVNGLIDSDEERELLRQEDDTAVETPQTEHERTVASDNLNGTLKRRVKPGRRIKKPGRKIRTIVDSDDDEFAEGIKAAESTKTAVPDWYQTYTEDTLPNITFSFGIFWPFEKDNEKVIFFVYIATKVWLVFINLYLRYNEESFCFF